MGPQADVVDVGVGAAVFDQEVGDAIDREWAYLADVGSVVEDAGSDDFVELKGLVDELERGNQHRVKGSRFAAQIKWSEKHVALRVVALL
jgi:hypothetical protein